MDERISFFVRVRDSANPRHQDETSVTLNITPTVHFPKFSTYHFLFSVPENAPIGTVVGSIHQDSQFGNLFELYEVNS